MSELDPWINSAGGDGDRNSMVYHLQTGAQTSFEFNFSGGYIAPEDVKAYIYHSASGLTTEIDPVVLTGPSTIEVVPPVPVGDYLVIYRDTPKTQPLVDFATGAVLNEDNLDMIARQAVFVAAEMVDRFSEIKTSSDDAIARSYTALTTANEAKAESATAMSTANSAVTTAGNAVTTANSAVSTANSAVGIASGATDTADDAYAIATGIDGKAQTALDNSVAAVNTANGIDGKAQTALDNSAAAVSTANTANTKADNAVATAGAVDAKASQAMTDASAAQAAVDALGTAAYRNVGDTGSAIPDSSRVNALHSTALTAATNANNNANTRMPTAGGTFSGTVTMGYFSGQARSQYLTLNLGNGAYSPTLFAITVPDVGYFFRIGNTNSTLFGLNSGTGDATLLGTLSQGSDRRYKGDITPIQDALADVTRLTGYTYTRGGKQEFGLIAQEVQEVFPELVGVADYDTGYLSLNYVGLIAPLIESVKALKAEVDDLRTQINPK